MKYIILAVVCLFVLPSCALVREFSQPDLTEEERAEMAENWRTYQERERARLNPEPGTSLSEFVEIWGNPDRSSFADGVRVYEYDNNGQPMKFFFRKNRLTSWKHDAVRADEIQAANREVAEQEQSRAQRKRQAWGAVMQGLSRGLEKKPDAVIEVRER